MTDIAAAIDFARHQDGVLTAQQAADLGLTASSLRNQVERHGWRRPLHGVLFIPEAAGDVDRSRARAAALCLPDGVISQRSAARFWRLDGLPQRTPVEPVTVMLPRTAPRRQRPGIRLTWSSSVGPDTCLIDGIPVTSPARTLRDLAKTEAREVVVCAAESAIRQRLLTLEDVRALGGSNKSLWALVDPRSQTPIETLVRLPLVDAGVGPLVSQYAVTVAGVVIAEIDLALPDYGIAVEADGREGHDNEVSFVWDRRRDVLLAEAGWLVIRFSWSDALRPAYIVRTVRRAVERRSAEISAARMASSRSAG